MKYALSLSIAAACMALVSGCGSSSSGGGGAVVTINGENVSQEQMARYLARKPTVRVVTDSGIAVAQVAETLEFQALQDMIAQRAMLQLAQDEGVAPTQAQVEQEIQFRKKINPNFLKELTAAGFTFDMIKENLSVELARENLLTKGITVTAEEADQYIKANPQQFMDPASADLLWVFVKTKTAQGIVDREIASGQSFQSIAIRYSEFPNAREVGGRFPERVIDKMRPELKKLVVGTAVGKLTDWLQLSDGFAKFYVEKKSPAKPMEMDEVKKELVRRSMARQRGEQGSDLDRRILDKIKASTISVTDKVLKDAWKKAFDRLQQEGKAPASATGAPTAEAPATGG